MAREAEVPGQSAELGRSLDSALNVDSLYGVALFNIIDVLEEVQVQVKAIGSFH